jgi:Family of unknown function (DUF6665)
MCCQAKCYRVLLWRMTLRPPRPSSRTSHSAALDYEMAQEQAAAVGRLGRALEAALAALRKYEIEAAARPSDPPSRAKLIQDASDALWCFIVQRESCGLRDPRPVYRDYRIPPEVQNRMGAFEVRHGRRR